MKESPQEQTCNQLLGGQAVIDRGKLVTDANGRAIIMLPVAIDGSYQFHMVVKKGIEQDEKFATIFRTLCGQISQGVFNGAPVELQLCHEYMKTIRVIGP